MAENRPFNIEVSGKKIAVTPDNLGIAMFRKAPDLDYLDFHEEVEGVEGEAHTLVFFKREVLIWMGGVALNAGDARILQLANRTHGSFGELMGWRPPVFVEDSPSDWEEEMYIQAQIPEDLHTDLNNALREELTD